MRPIAHLLGLALLIAACSESDTPTKPAVNRMAKAPDTSAIDSLIPADTTYLVRIESVSKLNAMLERFVTESGNRIPTQPLAMLAPMMGVDPAVVDLDKPLYVAFGLEAGPSGLPPVTLIAPTADPAKAAAAFEGGGTGSVEGYVAFSQDPGYKGGGAEALMGMPGGLVSIRCDSARLRARYGEEIAQIYGNAHDWMSGALAGPEQADSRKMVERLIRWAQQMSGAAQKIDVSLNEEAGEFDVHVAVVTDGTGPHAPRGPAAATLVELGRCLPDDMALSALFHMNISALTDWSNTTTKAAAKDLPEDQRKRFEAYLRKAEQLNTMLGDDWAFGIDLTDTGVRGAMVVTAKDPEAYIRRYQEVVADSTLGEFGMHFENAPSRQSGDVSVRAMRFGMDVEKYLSSIAVESGDVGKLGNAFVEALLGENGLLVELAARGDRVYIGMGHPSVMDQMLARETAPRWLAEEREAVPGELGFLVRVEPVGLLRSGMLLVSRAMPDASAPPLPTGGPSPVILTATVDGDVYRLHARMNPGRLATLVPGR